MTATLYQLRTPTARLLHEHVAQLQRALDSVEHAIVPIERWGRALADMFARGGRLLAAGNGGSAAHAQHLSSELVGRYRDDREPMSAFALHNDTSTITAIVNDYGPEVVFARQVRAHARPGDVVMLLSTSGRSRNLLVAADMARAVGARVWALTGAAPNPLAQAADDAICIDADTNATVQEVHQLVVHLLCEAIEAATR